FPSSFGVVADPWFKSADVVQLYNTHGSYFSHSALPVLSRRRPVVWRLSDMWAFTGHVAYSYDCERWRHGCGSCPYLTEDPALAGDAIALSYAAADFFVLPTLAENLPNAAIESLACGTPVVSFDVGGMPDAVRHMETGYLAKLADADALAEGIRTLLMDETLRQNLS